MEEIRKTEISSILATPKKESAVDVIINRIADSIISGSLKPGDRLPTEVQLAEIMGVSKNTVREAIKILIAYGVVEIRRPEGTFICNGVSPKMMNPLMYSILLNNSNTDILGLREMIDTGLCLLIIKNGLSAEDEEKLEAQHKLYCNLIQSENFDVERILEEDLRFHELLAKAAKNELVYAMNDFVLGLTRESRARALKMAYEDGKNIEYLMAAHRKTLDLVEKKSDVVLSSVLDFTYKYWKNSYDL